MIPVVCQVKHDPDAGTYGDCIRACVASILELTPDQVPHFVHDNCAPVEANRRLREFLATLGYAPFVMGFEGSDTLDDVLTHMREQNPNVIYMLFGRTDCGDHVIVCRGGEVAHDPAWYSSPLIGPGSSGYWAVMVIARS